MDAKADSEKDDEVKWHATKSMMLQCLACYKREQLVAAERQKGISATREEAGRAGITTKGSSSSGSSNKRPGSSGFVNMGSSLANATADVMDFFPPPNVVQRQANQAGTLATRGGWGGTSTGRF